MKGSIITKAVMTLSLLGLVLVVAAEEVGLWAYTLNSSSFAGTSAAYRVNPNFTDPSAGSTAAQIASIQAGANEWQTTGGANFQFVYQGTTTGTSLSPDGVNRVFYSNTDGGGALAVCYWWSSGGSTTNFDIAFYDRDGPTNFVWATNPSGGQFDIQGVVTHELGHALGLGHSTVNGATMYPSVQGGSTAARSLEPDDQAGVQALYGLAAPSVTGVSPSSGFVDGGYPVLVSGTGFQAGTQVTFNGVASASVFVLSSTSISCVVPAGSAQGAVSVAISGAGGGDSLPAAFTYDTCRSLSGGTLVPGWNSFECKVPQDAGKPYIAAFSTVSANTPMSTVDPLDTRFFPLGWSDAFYYSINAATIPLWFWNGTYGTLDPSGSATFNFWGFSGPGLSGFQIHTAFITTDATAPSGMSTISNRVTVTFP